MRTDKTLMPVIIIAFLLGSCNYHDPITYASPEEEVVDRFISCSGFVVTEPENRIRIVSPVSGRIIRVSGTEGQFMKAGTEVTAIENTDFIILQQDYLEARNLFDFYKEEYARQGDLTVENATSLKKMQIARRDYQSAELKYNALSMQLTILGVYPDSLQPDQLISALPVNAPRSGIVSQTYIQSGTYVEKGQLLFEMVSKQHVLIKIQVPEASFKSIEEGQMVNCRPAFDSLATLIATIRSIVPRIDPENHMATVYASLSDQSSGIVPGMSVDVMIHAGKDTLHLISPGIIQTDRNGQFIVVREKGAYLKVPVEPELTIDGKTGISGLPHELSDSLVIAGFKQLGPLRILK